MTKYKRWHDAIISRARKRTLDGYSEKHHVKPKCMGGSDSKRNIVRLTYREHFIVHWLLTKIVPRKFKRKIKAAFVMMSCRRNDKLICSWQYEVVRRTARDAALGVKFSKERCENIVKGRKGFRHSEKTKAMYSKMRIGNKNRLGIPHTEEIRRQISETLKSRYSKQPHHTKGTNHSDEARGKISERMNYLYQFGDLKEKRKRQAAERGRGPDGRFL